MIAGSTFFFIHMKYVVFVCRTMKILISNWPWTRKFSHLLRAGKYSSFWLLLPWSHVGHVLRPVFMLWLVKIWQGSSFGKFMQHLETCLLLQLKLTEFFVNLWCFKLSFSTRCTKWNPAAISCYLWRVCLLGFWLRNTSLVKFGNPISKGIVFVKHLACCVRGLKSLKLFWPYLIASRSCISNGKPE